MKKKRETVAQHRAKKKICKKWAEAERAGEWVLIKFYDCVITRKAMRTKFQKVDFWGADCVGKRIDGSHVYVQVTTGHTEAARTRRRKLDAIPWHESDKVMLFQLDWHKNPENARKIDWYFRIHERDHDGNWTVNNNWIYIPPLWFTAYKPEKDVSQEVEEYLPF